MNTVELIRKKRDGISLNKEEISYLVAAYAGNKIPDYQFSAFLMAVYLKGMTKEETASLTHAMLYSGKVIDLSGIEGVKVDKHSTGGVGDKTSLILAPAVAQLGVKVPMISGRGLGHTGGTLDKLESIPGFNTGLNLSQYKKTIKKCGTVLIGQTKEIAPADKLIYALRDVTATVESIPLITSSIMSKKLAEGIDGLVLDIKTGSGAFMREMKDAQALATSLINTAKAFDKRVIGFITDMNQPLGNYIGNWLEVYESILMLNGELISDLAAVTLSLAGAMVYLGNKAESIEEGVYLVEKTLKDGSALDKFMEIVKLQGGDVKYIKDPASYPKAKYIENVYSDADGFVTSMDNYRIGVASLELGAGRKTKEDIVDAQAGIVIKVKLGDKIKKGELIAELHTNKKKSIESSKRMLIDSIALGQSKVRVPKLIKQVIL